MSLETDSVRQELARKVKWLDNRISALQRHIDLLSEHVDRQDAELRARLDDLEYWKGQHGAEPTVAPIGSKLPLPAEGIPRR